MGLLAISGSGIAYGGYSLSRSKLSGPSAPSYYLGQTCPAHGSAHAHIQFGHGDDGAIHGGFLNDPVG